MKFTADRETLLKPLQIVQGVAHSSQKSSALSNILSNILITVQDSILRFTATDTEIELGAEVSVDESVNGEITVSARKFIDICRVLPSQMKVTCELDDDRVVVRSGVSRFTLNTLTADNFPTTDELTDAVAFTISQLELKQLINTTQFSMANQDVRYYLNGLLLEINPRQVKTVATDGHRLAVAQFDVTTGIEESKSIIIPRKGVIELMRLLTDDDHKLDIRVGANAIQMIIGNVRFYSKLIDGKFPDYQRVIPNVDECDKQISMNRESLRQCLARVAVLANNKHQAIRWILKSDFLQVSMRNPEQETAEDKLEVEYTGETLEIGFNVSYLIDALSILSSETADLFLKDTSSSCLIQPHGNASCQLVIMPMRL